MIPRGQSPRPKTETILKNGSDGGGRGKMEKSQHKTNNSRIRIGDLATFELLQLLETQNFYGLDSERAGIEGVFIRLPFLYHCLLSSAIFLLKISVLICELNSRYLKLCSLKLACPEYVWDL